ncbi:MAG: rhodanese-like domain-containing protein [Anaeromyxobacteraceae bacterium]
MTHAAVALAALAGLALGIAPAFAADRFKEVRVDDVEKMLGQPDVKVFDANPPDLWEKNHLPGATFIGDKKLATLLPADKETKLVFYCAGPK